MDWKPEKEHQMKLALFWLTFRINSNRFQILQSTGNLFGAFRRSAELPEGLWSFQKVCEASRRSVELPEGLRSFQKICGASRKPVEFPKGLRSFHTIYRDSKNLHESTIISAFSPNQTPTSLYSTRDGNKLLLYNQIN
jgi:hypothetical protein